MGHDLRMVPLAAAAWAATWLGTGAPQGLLPGVGVAALTGTAAGLRRSGWLAAIALVLAAGLAVGALHHHGLASGPVRALAESRAVVSVELVVTSDPQSHPAVGAKPAYLTVHGRVRSIDGRGSTWRVRSPVLLTVTGAQLLDWQHLPVGARVITHGRLEVPADPGGDISAVLRVRAPTSVTAPPSAGLLLVERVRSGLRTSVSGRQEEARALVPALVLGDVSAMTPQITEDFQVTGLTHLTAVSGANLTLLLAFLLLTARWAGVRGWWLRGVGLLGVVVFVAVCRSEPSVLRAAAMGVVALAALGAGGGRKGLRTLSVAMLVLLMVDPFLSRSLGFALSVLACAGIVWWAGRWAELLHGWLPKLVAESVAVPVAAQLATLPLVAAISGRVSVVGVVANAFAGPFVGPATVLGFAAAGLSLASPVAASVAGFGAAWSAQMILWVSHLGARFPGASWHWPSSPQSLLVLGLLSVGIGWAMPHLLVRPWLTLTLTFVLVLGFVRAPVQPGWPPTGWVLISCDVGQGDGLVVRVGEGAALVVDAGPDPASMGRCLDQLHVTSVPLLVLTHFHADHVSGLSGVFARRQVREVWVSPRGSPSLEAAKVRAEAKLHGVPVKVPAMGAQGQLGEVSWRVLGPMGRPVGTLAAGTDGESAGENDSSVVLQVTVRGIRILLTGDVEPAGQDAILASGADLRVDVLKLPHHGSAHVDPAFIAATHARVAIASAGLHNDYGHPAPRTVQLVQDLGMTLLRTDLDGSVAIQTLHGELAAVTQHPR